MSELAVPLLSRDEARSLTDEVKHDAERLWRKLVELYDGGAHLALGYSSWGAYFTTEFGGSARHGYRLLDAGRALELVGDQLVTPASEAQARELAPLLKQPEKLREAWREVVEGHPEPTAANVQDIVARRRGIVLALTSSESDEWYTPTRYVEAARTVLGGIDLDPASCDQANKVVQAEFYSLADDGLAREWHGRVWLNPPYGRKAPLFVDKLAREYEAGRVSAAVLLVNAYSTETRWFQPLLAQPVCFTDHRINFYSPSRRNSTPTYGSAFVYFGPDEATFVRVFRTFGRLVREIPSEAS